MARTGVKMVDRFRGAMLGGLVGDCLGAHFEMQYEGLVPLEEIEDFFADQVATKDAEAEKFQYTDDSAMARQIAQHLISSKGRLDPRELARGFTTEYFREPWRGYGGSVVEVFSKLKKADYSDPFQPARDQFQGSGSYGNGAGMRAHPVGLVCHMDTLETLVDTAEKVARLTHNHPLGVHGGVLQAAAVHQALQGSSHMDILERVVELASILEKDYKCDTASTYKAKMDLVTNYLDKKDDDLEEICFELGNDVSAVDSVPTALFCFLKVAKESSEDKDMFEKVLRLAIRMGGDTDTIASMACSITGAFLGVEAIPSHLYTCCERAEEVDQMGRQLYEVVVNKNKEVVNKNEKVVNKNKEVVNKNKELVNKKDDNEEGARFDSSSMEADKEPRAKKAKEDF